MTGTTWVLPLFAGSFYKCLPICCKQNAIIHGVSSILYEVLIKWKKQYNSTYKILLLGAYISWLWTKSYCFTHNYLIFLLYYPTRDLQRRPSLLKQEVTQWSSQSPEWIEYWKKISVMVSNILVSAGETLFLHRELSLGS